MDSKMYLKSTFLVIVFLSSLKTLNCDEVEKGE